MVKIHIPCTGQQIDNAGKERDHWLTTCPINSQRLRKQNKKTKKKTNELYKPADRKKQAEDKSYTDRSEDTTQLNRISANEGQRTQQ